MKVGSLFAEIGFKVDKSGLDQFSTALKAFQKTVKDGLKDLKEYAKAAREISNAMRDAYIPNQREARARYNAQTRELSASARQRVANARRTEAELRAGTPALRASRIKQDSDSRFINAVSRFWQTSQKERGLTGTHTGKYSQGILGLLRGIASFNIGGIAGGIASIATGGHPIALAIAAGTKAILSAIRWLGKTFREGIRVGLAYRDYMSFTGRSTGGISRLLAASLGTTSMSPSDVMKDIQSLEKNYWEMMFGGASPRAWQMMGILPTGNGEVDLKNILKSVYATTNGFEEKGMARYLLGQFGLSEEYIQLVENLSKTSSGFEELFAKTKEQIAITERGNKILREYDERINQIKLKITEAIVNSGLLAVLEKLSQVLIQIIDWISAQLGWNKTEEQRRKEASKRNFKEKLTDYLEYYGSPIWGLGRVGTSLFTGDWSTDSILDKLVRMGGGNTNNLTLNTTNEVTVANAQEASEYVNGVQYNSVKSAWWGTNAASRNAPSIGSG